MKTPKPRRDQAPGASTAHLAVVFGALAVGACGDDSSGGDGGRGGAGGAPSTSSVTSSVTATSTGVTATVATATGTSGGQGGGGSGPGGAGGGGGRGGAGASACADGSVCEGALCVFDPPSETWGCVPEADCQGERRCGDECCAVGSRCDAGACQLPDLSIDRARLLASVELETKEFGQNACEIVEGCIDAPGVRRLLRFDLKTPNAGDGDLFLGQPSDNEDLFEFSSCHNHYHFTTYAAYRLLDGAGRVVATGHKQAFCLLDFERQEGGAPNGVYSCGYQGIQHGWADIYDSYLPCQWVDVTDVPPGDYQLEVTLNAEHVLIESDYDNDVSTIPVVIAPNSCPAGCPAWDDAVCQPGDPQGRAGDGACDCAGLQEWDVQDCAACEGCPVPSCPGGCAAPLLGCCGPTDTCGRAGNGVCDCDGAAPWDAADCDACVSADVDCPAVDSCPNGCGFSGNQCQGLDPASLADGWCDCADQGWDTIDCFSCTSACGQN